MWQTPGGPRQLLAVLLLLLVLGASPQPHLQAAEPGRAMGRGILLSQEQQGQGEATLTIVNPRENTVAHITIAGEGYEENLTLPPGGKVGYPVEPGSYTITIRLEPPENTIGDPESLTVHRTIAIPPGGKAVVPVPLASQMLARLSLGPFPESVNVRIHWDGGSTSMRLHAGEAVILNAVPGTYRVEISRADWLAPLARTYTTTLTLDDGDLASLREADLSLSTPRLAAIAAGIIGTLTLPIIARRRR